MLLKQHFIKNSDFKTVLGSGIFGGITSGGFINMVIYTERVPLPDSITIEIEEETGEVKGEISRETRDGTLRELQMGIILDINTAKATVDWLNLHINNLEKILESNK